jgi:hypothetical protein
MLPKDVAAVCAKRPDIEAADAAHIEASCERQYQQWLASNKGRSPRDARAGAGEDGEGDRKNMLANMYKRVVKAVGMEE